MAELFLSAQLIGLVVLIAIVLLNGEENLHLL